MRKVRPIQAVVGSDSSAIQLTGGLLVELMVVLMDVERLGLVVQFGRVPAHSDVEGKKRAGEIEKGDWGGGRVGERGGRGGWGERGRRVRSGRGGGGRKGGGAGGSWRAAGGRRGRRGRGEMRGTGLVL